MDKYPFFLFFSLWWFSLSYPVSARILPGIPSPVIIGLPAPSNCCFGGKKFLHQEVVLSLPKVCLRLVCNFGEIETQYLGEPGQTECCEFDGVLYASGSELPLHCLKFFCKRGSWYTDGEIEDCCEHCYLYNDPHIVTFDKHRYDWHGTCNYSITQTGFGHNPEIGVFSDFIPCNGKASCLSRTTFRDNKNTLIVLDNGMVNNYMVNGELHTVTSLGVQQVTSSDGPHPVLVFKTGRCIALVGSSKLALLHCPDRLDIWTHPSHTENLNGLCGHYNSYKDDDFTTRNNDQEPLMKFPMAFPSSWLTNLQSDRSCYDPCPICFNSETEDPCMADAAKRRKYLQRCRNALQKTTGDDVELVPHIDACAFDVCLMYQNGEDDKDVEDWIRQLQDILQVSKLIQNKKLSDPCKKFCTKILKPVCATDGNTYSNMCLLDIASCQNPCIGFKHEGRCNPGCPIQICTLEFFPICGTDGKTYSNQCELEASMCDDPCLRKKHDGRCGDPSAGDPCKKSCTKILKPVCATDGNTYSNMCLLDIASCQNPCIGFKHEGRCNPVCPIEICTLEFMPICGTDGKTYSNKCRLAAAMCNDPCLRKKHDGGCGFTACNTVCHEIFRPVCGSGVTYPNQCELDIAKCKNPCIEFTHEGPCQQECPVFFCTKEIVPVCGTDGRTYVNQCLLELAQCEDPCIKKARDGLCFGIVDPRSPTGEDLEVASDAILEVATAAHHDNDTAAPHANDTAANHDNDTAAPTVYVAAEDSPDAPNADPVNPSVVDAANPPTAYGANPPLSSEPVVAPPLSEEVCKCIQKKKPLIKQAVQDYDFLHWLMNDVYAKAAVVNTRLGQPRVIEGPAEGRKWRLSLWSKLKESFRIAVQAINDIREVWQRPRSVTDGMEDPTAIGDCSTEKMSEIFRLLNEDFNEILHVRADFDNNVAPPEVVGEILENMPLAISSLKETEADYKEIIDKLNVIC